VGRKYFAHSCREVSGKGSRWPWKREQKDHSVWEGLILGLRTQYKINSKKMGTTTIKRKKTKEGKIEEYDRWRPMSTRLQATIKNPPKVRGWAPFRHGDRTRTARKVCSMARTDKWEQKETASPHTRAHKRHARRPTGNISWVCT